jgi:hypothetical protein
MFKLVQSGDGDIDGVTEGVLDFEGVTEGVTDLDGVPEIDEVAEVVGV